MKEDYKKLKESETTWQMAKWDVWTHLGNQWTEGEENNIDNNLCLIYMKFYQITITNLNRNIMFLNFYVPIHNGS